MLVIGRLDFVFFWWKQHLICTDQNVSATLPSGVASPNFFWGQTIWENIIFGFKRKFCLGHRLSKHKMTRYAKYLGVHGPLATPMTHPRPTGWEPLFYSIVNIEKHNILRGFSLPCLTSYHYVVTVSSFKPECVFSGLFTKQITETLTMDQLICDITRSLFQLLSNKAYTVRRSHTFCRDSGMNTLASESNYATQGVFVISAASSWLASLWLSTATSCGFRTNSLVQGRI